MFQYFYSFLILPICCVAYAFTLGSRCIIFIEGEAGTQGRRSLPCLFYSPRSTHFYPRGHGPAVLVEMLLLLSFQLFSSVLSRRSH